MVESVENFNNSTYISGLASLLSVQASSIDIDVETMFSPSWRKPNIRVTATLTINTEVGIGVAGVEGAT